MFLDPHSVTGDDSDQSLNERRFVTFGVSSSGRLLVVAHVHRGDVIRINQRSPCDEGREEAL